MSFLFFSRAEEFRDRRVCLRATGDSPIERFSIAGITPPVRSCAPLYIPLRHGLSSQLSYPLRSRGTECLKKGFPPSCPQNTHDLFSRFFDPFSLGGQMIGQTLSNRYDIRAELGRGGM